MSVPPAPDSQLTTRLANYQMLSTQWAKDSWDKFMSEEKLDQRTLVTFLLDRTGAAEAVRDQTIEAFNACLATLKAGAGDDIEFTMIQYYRDKFDPVHVCRPIRNVPTLKARTYLPCEGMPTGWLGMRSPLTRIAHHQNSLIDAVWKTMTMVSELLQHRNDSPKVAICIHIDGEEGKSTEHTWEELNVVLKGRIAQDWQINFIRGGIFAYDQGILMGLPKSHIVQFARFFTRQAHRTFAATAQNIVAFARGERNSTAFSKQQKYDIGDQFWKEE